MKLKDSQTFKNLARAFAGECQARTRYEFIEYGARKQGYKALADIIDKIAYQEFTHARMIYSFIQSADTKTIDNIEICTGYPFRQKWDLMDNLKFASEDEGVEAEELYPEFAKVAEEEGFHDIAALFRNLIKIEETHQNEFKRLYNQFKAGKLYKTDTEVVWKCPECGYESTSKEAFEICPVCQAKQGAVTLKEA
ncbi:MAG: rubrerythrin family protein [Clostridia bacterium]|nr:rubrerythrin family protein [Clostridia bacterium]MDE7328469.1 rubrerythrin family protein [Clostridia bacterium]